MPITKTEIELNNSFFISPKENSRVKALFVAEYFPKFCYMMIKKYLPQKFGYFDLFSGPGVYDDGTPSTPILVAKNCMDKDWLRERAWLVFNDYYYSEKLKENFDAYIGIDNFLIRPHFGHSEVGESQSLNQFLTTSRAVNGENECPTVLFFDPYDYKAIETSVLCSFLKDWGNEIFLFFNTKRTTLALASETFDEKLMNKLFPKTSHKMITFELSTLKDSFARIQYLIRGLKMEFQKIISTPLFCSQFQFVEDDAAETSHFLLHITKNRRSVDLLRSILDSHGELTNPGESEIMTYLFKGKEMENELTKIFNQTNNEENVLQLTESLDNWLAKMKGGISALALFDEHQTVTQLSRRHYLQAIRKLVADKRITATFTDGKPHKVNVMLSDTCILESNKHNNK